MQYVCPSVLHGCAHSCFVPNSFLTEPLYWRLTFTRVFFYQCERTVVSATPSISKYKHLLTFQTSRLTIRLIQKFCEYIIYLVMIWFIIRYTSSMTYLFLYFNFFLNKTDGQTRCLKVNKCLYFGTEKVVRYHLFLSTWFFTTGVFFLA